jgi:tetratricopeptide (TPR) repeat protein
VAAEPRSAAPVAPAPPAPAAPDEAAVPAPATREPKPAPIVERQAPPAAPPPKVQRPPRSMQMEGAPSGGPPRALVVGVAIAVVGLAVMLAVFGWWNKHRPPPPAAVEALSRAKVSADNDSLPALAEAESQATAAIDGTPRGYPAAYAELATIEVAWADALNDEASFSSDRAERAGRAGDDRTKLEANGRASAFQDQAKGRLRQAFEAAVAGNRLDPKSADAALALADYYRAAGSRTNMSLELKRAANLGADPAAIAFVQGADFLGQEDPASHAVERLEAAVKGAPGSARLRFRLAMAYLKAQRTAEAQKELQETLRLSPAHERAKLALEALAGRAETRDGKKR